MVNRNASNGHRVNMTHMRGRDTSIEQRVGRQIVPQANRCWLWKGRTDTYGRTDAGKGTMTIHRFVYETLVGEIEEGHHLHHKCETPGCCNPHHLESLTPKEHAAAHKALRLAS